MKARLNSKEEIKEAKKTLTKLANKLNKKANKLSEGMKEFTNVAVGDFSFDEKSELKSAVWHFHSYHPFSKSILEDEKSINIIKKKYPELAGIALKVHNELKPLAVEVKELEEHIESEKQRLAGTTAQQFLRSASKSKELDEQKRKDFLEFANNLNDWQEARIENGNIIVNGKNVGKEAQVGVMIGKGVRVHPMKIYIGIHKDKKTNTEKEVIYIENYTQWYRSDLVILDTIENIPQGVIARK
jgi:hypothetical protein